MELANDNQGFLDPIVRDGVGCFFVHNRNCPRWTIVIKSTISCTNFLDRYLSIQRQLQSCAMNRDIFTLCEFEKATEARQIPAYWQLWDILNWTGPKSSPSSSSPVSSASSCASSTYSAHDQRRHRSPSDASSEKSSVLSSLFSQSQ